MSITIPQQARSEQSLEKILSACDKLLLDRAFEQISMQDIAREAGMSVGNLYNRFSDKSALIDHVMVMHQARFIEKIKTLVANNGNHLDTTARLEQLITTFSDGLIVLRPLYTTMAARRARGENTETLIQRQSLEQLDLCVDWLRAGDPKLDAERCRFALAIVTTSLLFDLLYGTHQRMFGQTYHKQLIKQSLAYITIPKGKQP